jgi:hypothetical protein
MKVGTDDHARIIHADCFLPGVDRIHKSMTAYVKAISKRNEGDDKEKTLPIAHLGSSMVSHGEDFDANSEYGQSLISKLRSWWGNERKIAWLTA